MGFIEEANTVLKFDGVSLESLKDVELPIYSFLEISSKYIIVKNSDTLLESGVGTEVVLTKEVKSFKILTSNEIKLYTPTKTFIINTKNSAEKVALALMKVLHY